MLTAQEIVEVEDKLSHVLGALTPTEGDLDVDTEFEKIMFSKSGPSQEACDDIRQMTRRFGPKLMQMLGFPPAPGACRIQVSKDGMEARLDIDPPAGDGIAVTVEQVRNLLNEQKIIFGLDDEAIEKAVETGRAAEIRGLCAAHGRPVRAGRDGRIEPIKHWSPAPAGMDIPAGDPQIAVSEIDTVEKGQKIAKLVPPDPGEPGRDVFGWEVKALPGKPVSPQVGENVSFDANAGYFYAKSPGRVVILDALIDIEKLMVFRGDVDISVGHVLFPGELMVRGWIRSGLSVQADQDIVVEGGVEAASVWSHEGSILIGKGIQGMGLALVQAAWDVTVKFVEQATVMAGGVLKTQSALNSELAGGEAVIVTEGKGAVIGGRIYAGDRMEVRELGAGTGDSTVVQLGITPDILKNLTKLKARRQAAEQALADAEQTLARYGLSSEALQAQAMTEEGRQLLKMAKTVLVLHERCRKIREEEDKFNESMRARTEGELDVRGRVYPGVKILIGPAVHYVTEPLSWVRFRYDAEKRRIKAVPLV